MGTNKGRVLVTGGAGLIGSHLVDLLIEKGYEVNILDNLEPQTHPKGRPVWLNPRARFFQGDVRDGAALSQALEGVCAVFHQAAFGGFTPEISKYIDVNTIGTARLFEQIAKGKSAVRKIVVASSQAVYGEGAYRCERHGLKYPSKRPPAQIEKKNWELFCSECESTLQPIPVSEEKPSEGETAYALSKEFEERLALAYGKQLGIPTVALRYAVTYGPRQSIFNPYTGVVSIFSTRLLNNLPPLVYEDGQQTRDFIYVGDVVHANLFVMESEAADFKVFNVGTGIATSVEALARELASIYGKKIGPKIPGEFRHGDVRHILLDPSPLSRLGFRAATSLKEGLGHFAEWMRTHERVEEYFSEAYGNLKRNRIIHG